jgi:hypothetical protein
MSTTTRLSELIPAQTDELHVTQLLPQALCITHNY